MNATHHALTRWGARSTAALAVLTLGLGAMPTSASAATSADPSVVGGAGSVRSGSSVTVSFPAYTLTGDERSTNRTVHVRVVSRAADCSIGGVRLTGSVQAAVPFADLDSPYRVSVDIPSRAQNPSIESYSLCAFQVGEVSRNGQLSSVASNFVTWPILAGANNPVAVALPGTPAIVSGATATGVPTGGAIQVSAGLLSSGPAGDQATRRVIRKSVVAAPGVDSCAGGSGVSELDIAPIYGLRDATVNLVVNGAVGKYLCVDQILATTSNPQARTSPPLVSLITGHTPTGVGPAAAQGVAAAIARAQAAQQRLVNLNVTPNVNAADAAAALQEALAAQAELQAAQAAAANNDPANNDPANNAPADGVVAANAGGADAANANDALRQQLENTLGGATVAIAPQSNPTLISLAAATGFDPLATPVLAEGKANDAGIKLTVTKPKKIKRGKGFSVTLNVDPKATRGGMRQYLVRMDGDQPTLIHKRSGFITTGQRAKKYWISPKAPKGAYALLSTFAPSVPGTPGASIITPLTVK